MILAIALPLTWPHKFAGLKVNKSHSGSASWWEQTAFDWVLLDYTTLFVDVALDIDVRLDLIMKIQDPISAYIIMFIVGLPKLL